MAIIEEIIEKDTVNVPSSPESPESRTQTDVDSTTATATSTTATGSTTNNVEELEITAPLKELELTEDEVGFLLLQLHESCLNVAGHFPR